jgi:hypothetical protein
MRRRNAIPRNEIQAQARERALAALALMRREHLSVKVAARAADTDTKTVLRYVGSALRRESPRGRYRPAAYDRIPRVVNFDTPTGPVWITVRDSRTASRIGEHKNAQKRYWNAGDSSALQLFKNKSFRASGVTYWFITDTATLDRLGDAGVPFEGLYRAVQGGTL